MSEPPRDRRDHYRRGQPAGKPPNEVLHRVAPVHRAALFSNAADEMAALGFLKPASDNLRLREACIKKLT
jgi:hypothetical protein